MTAYHQAVVSTILHRFRKYQWAESIKSGIPMTMSPLPQAQRNLAKSDVLQITDIQQFHSGMDCDGGRWNPTPCTLAFSKDMGIVDKILKNKTEGMTQKELQDELKKILRCFICKLRPAQGVLMPCACYGVCQLCTNPPPPVCPQCASVVTYFQKASTTGTLPKHD